MYAQNAFMGYLSINYEDLILHVERRITFINFSIGIILMKID
jgi:hypothetical protein